MDDLPGLMDSPQLAAHLKVKLPTLYRMRSTGNAPRGIRVGRRILYRPSDVQAWLESQADDGRAVA